MLMNNQDPDPPQVKSEGTQASEIVEWEPTDNLRYYTPNKKYVPERPQRQFKIKCADGVEGFAWAYVHEENTMVRKLIF